MRTVEWHQGRVRLIDQRQLPWTLTYIEYSDYRDVAQAISDTVVRGALAIGAAAAFGMALAAQQNAALDMGSLIEYLDVAAVILKKSRPTAINLAWAVDRMMRVANDEIHSNVREIKQAMLAEAQRIADDDVATNQRIAQHGAALIRGGETILHHAATGALASVGYGTALGAIRAAHEAGKKVRVLITETRPSMQGAHLSAWELKELGIPFEIIADSAAGYYMRKGEAQLVLVGADRIARNGDTANKIGTYMLAVLAKENNIPFYVVAPTSTIDLGIASGEQIPIEERTPEEMRRPHGNPLIPDDYPVRNPVFDITPQRYLAGIITENGLVQPPFRENLPKATGEHRRV